MTASLDRAGSLAPAAAPPAPRAPAAPRPVPAAAHPAAEAAASASAAGRLTGNRKLRTGSACILLAGAGSVALWGGHVGG